MRYVITFSISRNKLCTGSNMRQDSISVTTCFIHNPLSFITYSNVDRAKCQTLLSLCKAVPGYFHFMSPFPLYPVLSLPICISLQLISLTTSSSPIHASSKCLSFLVGPWQRVPMQQGANMHMTCSLFMDLTAIWLHCREPRWSLSLSLVYFKSCPSSAYRLL